jgi:lysylphosphatidylglycerol synthetase-like protein (DUF2156 family)
MNAATKAKRPPSPQDREDLADFLLRTAGFAALLSLLLMFGPPVLLSLWPPNLTSITASIGLLILSFPYLIIVILIALLVSAAVTLCLGAVLAAACRARGIGTIGTRMEAMRFGAIAGAVIALVEAIVILLYWTSYTGPSRELGAGIAFFLQNPPPYLRHALKVMFDMAATIGIGALSGWLAWRPPRPSPSPAKPSPPAA